jgi:fatty acyl-CoA reductase
LITGGNGFIGKVLVEKLLRCFDIDKIYLLMRQKNNENVEKRMENFINEPVNFSLIQLYSDIYPIVYLLLFTKKKIFDMLHERNPVVLRKIIPVEVDYSAYDLNINSTMLDRIQSEVQVGENKFKKKKINFQLYLQIVFNVVASVKFNESLDDAIDINFYGTKKVVKLVMNIEKLKSFVHVSTLYTNCNRSDIDEKIYDHIFNYNQLASVASLLKDAKNEYVENLLFHQLPNTYTLTKHFAEKFVYHQTFFMPSGIFRPPIVFPNYKDFPGYTDNVNGPSGIIAWAVRGYIHVIYGDSCKRANLVPVDFCINALIATAWDVHEG